MIAGIILSGIGGVFCLISTVLYIVLLVKLFKHGGIGLGILGFFCSLFTYIWGWMKASELGLKNLMIWLTITMLIAAALIGAGAPDALREAEAQQRLNSPSR
jgi:peptidoglycan biosynthesis protein MviN/MurJ (putative lipid II flippase)